MAFSLRFLILSWPKFNGWGKKWIYRHTHDSWYIYIIFIYINWPKVQFQADEPSSLYIKAMSLMIIRWNISSQWAFCIFYCRVTGWSDDDDTIAQTTSFHEELVSQSSVKQLSHASHSRRRTSKQGHVREALSELQNLQIQQVDFLKFWKTLKLFIQFLHSGYYLHLVIKWTVLASIYHVYWKLKFTWNSLMFIACWSDQWLQSSDNFCHVCQIPKINFKCLNEHK